MAAMTQPAARIHTPKAANAMAARFFIEVPPPVGRTPLARACHRVFLPAVGGGVVATPRSYSGGTSLGHPRQASLRRPCDGVSRGCASSRAGTAAASAARAEVSMRGWLLLMAMVGCAPVELDDVETREQPLLGGLRFMTE